MVDTNVRRVMARAIRGRAEPAPPSPARDHAEIEALLPAEAAAAARFSVALMELGALVCTARNPQCGSCPLAECCAWRAAGAPPPAGPARTAQRFAGTDRQVRGRLLDVLRGADGPVDRPRSIWSGRSQCSARRALDTLIVDGLIDAQPGRSVRAAGLSRLRK